MSDWKEAAWAELKAYKRTSPEELISGKKERLREIRDRQTSIRSAGVTVTPVQSSRRGADRLDDLLDEERRLQAEIRAEEIRAKVIRRGLSLLSDTERTVLEGFAAAGKVETALADLIDVTGYERTQLYKIKEEALRRYTLALYGVLDF